MVSKFIHVVSIIQYESIKIRRPANYWGHFWRQIDKKCFISRNFYFLVNLKPNKVHFKQFLIINVRGAI